VTKRRTKANGDRSIHRKPGRPRAERIFYVAVEGESTEPDYLAYLNKTFGEQHQFSIKPLYESNGLKPREVVAKAAEYVDEVREYEALYPDDDERRPQLWALFDRDQHTGIPGAFQEAGKAGITVAYSNPSFDLWLLLHLSDFSGAQSGSSDVVHEKLRKFAPYTKFSKRSKHLDQDRLDALHDHKAAADRARRLAGSCPTEGCSKHGHAAHCTRISRDPCTEVADLLVALKIISS
jgi:hypothetical protein